MRSALTSSLATTVAGIASRCYLLAFALTCTMSFASCALPTFWEPDALIDELPAYTLEVQQLDEALYSANGYDVRFTFVLRSEEPFPLPHLIQEIEQTTSLTLAGGKKLKDRITLVEAFRLVAVQDAADEGFVYKLEPLQRDRHFESGFQESMAAMQEVSISREVRLYPGFVQGADFTKLGFAHLPSNQDGSVLTDVPVEFNRAYQENHETRGAILYDHRTGGSRYYSIRYAWERNEAGGVEVSGNVESRGDFLITSDALSRFSPSTLPNGDAESAGR